jgi:hypothetical protein
MSETVSSVLASWSNFYIMTGSAAGGLTGLMFVVITLVTGIERLRGNRDALSTFSTPTVVHFGAALLVSAVLLAPWSSLVPPAITLGIAGLFGAVYMLRLWRRQKRLTTYTPDLEDWLCYTILPLVAYSAILAGAIVFTTIAPKALFALAGGSLLLIFIGIHNAWDIVTYIAIELYNPPPSESSTQASGATSDEKAT